jgi:hypothetical protein
MEAGAPIVEIAIMNVDSGPGAGALPKFVAQIRQAQKHGICILGYIYTSYGSQPIAQVEQEVSEYFAWYHVNGIFYDAAAQYTPQLAYYRALYVYAKSISPKSIVAINPGAPTVEGYMTACDLECDFENGYKAYESDILFPAWIQKYPANRFCNVIFDVPTVSDMRAVVALSRQRHAGWVYITPLNYPNPYCALPQEHYWSDELIALASNR